MSPNPRIQILESFNSGRWTSGADYVAEAIVRGGAGEAGGLGGRAIMRRGSWRAGCLRGGEEGLGQGRESSCGLGGWKDLVLEREGGSRGRSRRGWGSLGNPRAAPGDGKKTRASHRCPNYGRPEGAKGENLISGARAPTSWASI